MEALFIMRSLGVVERANIMSPERNILVDFVRTGEDILRTHVESVTQLKLLNNLHCL